MLFKKQLTLFSNTKLPSLCGEGLGMWHSIRSKNRQIVNELNSRFNELLLILAWGVAGLPLKHPVKIRNVVESAFETNLRNRQMVFDKQFAGI